MPIRWGILGAGRIAHKFVQDLLTLPGITTGEVELYAVASTSAERAAEFAAQYAIPHQFSTYDGLLSLPDLDVVYVATPHVQHHENALMCLHGGIAVLGEKPFAMNLAQVRDMVDTARSRKVFLMEALWSRFMPGIVSALELIESGAIGKVTSVKADFGFKAPFLPERRLFNKALGGGALLDIGIYPLFLAYLVLGKPATLKASATFGTTGVDEQCGMVLTYPEGQLALLDSTLIAQTETAAVIYGDNGYIKLHSRFQDTRSVTVKSGEEEPRTLTFDRNTFGYAYEAQHVVDCLRDGLTESPVWSLEDSLNLMELLDAARAEAGITYEYQ